MDVFIAGGRGELPGGKNLADLLQTLYDLLLLVGGQDRRVSQRGGPGLAGGDVDIVQPPVKGQAVVQPPHRVICRLLEHAAPQGHDASATRVVT